MLRHEDAWPLLLDKLAHPLDFIFELVKEEHLLLFMPYVVRHDRTEVVCKLIDPMAIGIEHRWCDDFQKNNNEKIAIAKKDGRKKYKDPTEDPARIFMTIEEFEGKSCTYAIENFEKPYKEIKSTQSNISKYEWNGLDDTYPIALLAKTDAGEVTGHLCSLVITLVYTDKISGRPKNREYLEKYLASLAKHKINVFRVSQMLSDLDATEWNNFRKCFSNEDHFTKHGFHHLMHGGDLKTLQWCNVMNDLAPHTKGLLTGSDFELTSYCNCTEQSVSACQDKVLGHPGKGPSVRELLQWTHNGKSLTRSLLIASPISIVALGLVSNDYCWCNPFCIYKLIEELTQSELRNKHRDECDFSIPNSGVIQGAYVYEDNTEKHTGLWLCIHIPGLLKPVTWPAIHSFHKIMSLARRTGAKNVYRINWKGDAEHKIWKIDENKHHWAEPISSIDQEFGTIVSQILPHSGLAIFIPARTTADERHCWEIDTGEPKTTHS